MVWKKHDYDDIPGTYVFDGETAHASYNINKMLYTFNSPFLNILSIEVAESFSD